MKAIISLVALIVAITSPIVSSDTLPSQTGGDAGVYVDVSYGDFERNTMDIYLPEKADNKTYGAILFIHGGSWTSGDKSSEAYLCKDYSKKGYVTATINYHYIDADNTISTNMDDIAAAIQTLKEFCTEKSYNITSLALHGYSSGAHLATLFSYSCPERSVIPISFVVDMVGPSDFNSDTWNEWDYDQNTGPGLALLLYGTNNLGDNITSPQDISTEKLQEVINSVSPIYHIDEDSVPTICGYAGDGKDGIVPTKNRTAIYEKLTQHNVKNDCFIFENSNHFLIGDSNVRKALYDKVDEYCKTYFGY